MAVPSLNILIIETNSPFTLGIGDLSTYPSGWNIVSPQIQITPPGFNSVVRTFTPNSINIFDSEALGISCDGEDKVTLPDGIYQIKYTINPSHIYYADRTYMRTNRMMENIDNLFISLDIAQCDKDISSSDFKKLRQIEMYVQFAISSANKCANIYANEAYQKAAKLITKYNKSHCVTC